MKNLIVYLKRLIQTSSKSTDISGVNRVGEIMIEMTKDLPLTWERHSKPGAADFLVARTSIDPSKPVITFSAHMDVVFETDKVEIKETENKLFGSGSADMKASLVIMIEVLRKLHEQGKLKNIILALSSEEEIATPNFKDVIENISKESDYVMVFEQTYQIDKSASLNKRSVVVSRRGFQQFDVEITGPGGHSGVVIDKKDRKNTILAASEIILKLEDLADYAKKTTLNTGMIEGGQAINVIAPSTKFSFEARFCEGAERDRIFAGFERIKQEVIEKYGVEIKYTENKFYPCLTKDQKALDFAKLCQEVGGELSLEVEIEERNGGSEASLFKYYNPNAAVLDGFGPRGYEEHTTEEYIYKDSLFTTIDFVESVIKKLIN